MSKLKEHNFIDRCANGELLSEQIDDFVDLWHEADSDLEIHEFLGMTRKEYSLWVEEPDILPYIVIAHQEKRNTIEVLMEIEQHPPVVCSDDSKKALTLKKRLKSLVDTELLKGQQKAQ